MWKVSFIKVFLFLDKKIDWEKLQQKDYLKKNMYNIIIFA